MPVCVSCHGEYLAPPSEEQESLLRYLVKQIREFWTKRTPESEPQSLASAPHPSIADLNTPPAHPGEELSSPPVDNAQPRADGKKNSSEQAQASETPDETAEKANSSGLSPDPDTSDKADNVRASSPGQLQNIDKSNEAETTSNEERGQVQSDTSATKSADKFYCCERCKQNNKAWHDWNNVDIFKQFERFFGGLWGLLLIISFILLPLVIILVGKIPATSKGIGILLGMLLSLFSLFLIYGLRNYLWERDCFARFMRELHPSTALLAVTALILALIFGVMLIVLLGVGGYIPEASLAEPSVQMAIALLLVLIFFCISLTLSFMAANSYSELLSRQMPAPIYTKERQFLEVIRGDLNSRMKKEEVDVTIAELKRIDDGGVQLMLDTTAAAGLSSTKEQVRRVDTLKIVTDRWGYIKQMVPENFPRYILVEKQQNTQAEVATNNAIVTQENGWEQGYKTQSKTTISVESSRQFRVN